MGKWLNELSHEEPWNAVTPVRKKYYVPGVSELDKDIPPSEKKTDSGMSGKWIALK